MSSTVRRLQFHHQGGPAPTTACTSSNASIEAVLVEEADAPNNAASHDEAASYFRPGGAGGGVATHSSSVGGGIGAFEEDVAERILETLQRKDACIAELRRSLEFVVMDRDRLKIELDDAVMGKDALLTQYHDVLKDLQDMERLRNEGADAKGQAERYAAALDEANKALSLQLEALNQQVSKCEQAESDERAASKDNLALQDKVQKLANKNRILLEELKKTAAEADEGSERHAEELRSVSSQVDAMHQQIQELKAVEADRKRVALELSASMTVASERLERIRKLEQELEEVVNELEDTRADRDEALAHVSAQRDALESTEHSQRKTESIAVGASEELQALRAHITELEQQKADLAHRLQVEHHQKEQMQIEIDDAINDASEWKSCCAASRCEITRLESQLEASTTAFEAKTIQWQHELDVCRHQLSTQQSILATRREFETTMTIEHQEQSHTLVELEDTLDAANFKLQKLQAKHQALLLEHRGLEEELRRTHVVHAAECHELQELSSAVASGQSKQLQEMAEAQQRLVGRLLVAEEEVARLTERSSQLEQSLMLREQDVHHMTKQHATELKRGQSLCAIAKEKEFQDGELLHLRSTVVPSMEKHIEELLAKLDASQRRCNNLKERSAHDAAAVARAKAIEEESADHHQLVLALREKVSSLETALSSKREALRCTLDERTKLVAQVEEMRRDHSILQSRLRAMQKHTDDHQRTAESHAREASEARSAAERNAEALQSALQKASQRIAVDLVAVVRVIVSRRLARSQQTQVRQDAAEKLLHRVLDKYERDVGSLQVALSESESALQQTVGALHTAEVELEALHQQHARQPSRPPLGLPVMDVSKELRPTCADISLDVLGLSLDDLIGLQQQQPHATSATDGEHVVASRPSAPNIIRRVTTSPLNMRGEFEAHQMVEPNELLDAYAKTQEERCDDDGQNDADKSEIIASAFHRACETPHVGELLLTAYDRSPLRSLLCKVLEHSMLAASDADDRKPSSTVREEMSSDLRDAARNILFGMLGDERRQECTSSNSSEGRSKSAEHLCRATHPSSASSSLRVAQRASLGSLLTAIVEVLV